jgi:hypothetical protein
VVTLVSQANAQDDKWSVLATTGLAIPVLDNGVGLHIGVNPSVRLTSRISAEGQLSYIYSRVNSAFLTGETNTTNAINALLGARLYLNGEDKRNRLFVNFLLGVNYVTESMDGSQVDKVLGRGVSTGLFLSCARFTVGLTIDTPAHFVLKAGYSF